MSVQSEMQLKLQNHGDVTDEREQATVEKEQELDEKEDITMGDVPL